jgi:hypothetical protein
LNLVSSFLVVLLLLLPLVAIGGCWAGRRLTPADDDAMDDD